MGRVAHHRYFAKERVWKVLFRIIRQRGELILQKGDLILQRGDLIFRRRDHLFRRDIEVDKGGGGGDGGESDGRHICSDELG